MKNLIYRPSLPLAERYICELKKAKFPFTVVKTNYTTQIKNQFVNYIFFDESMSFKTLGLVGKIRKEVENNYQNNFVWGYDKIKYMVYNFQELKPDSVLNNCIEIDINSAYLHAAKNLNLISNDTFNKVNKLNKINRLKALGSMATRKFIQEYENGEIISERIETNERLRAAWFQICYEIDKILFQCAYEIKKAFLFYYVDGIYVAPKTITDIDTVMNIISANGYEFKIKPVKIRVTQKQNLIVYDEKRARPFYVKKKQIKKIILL